MANKTISYHDINWPLAIPEHLAELQLSFKKEYLLIINTTK